MTDTARQPARAPRKQVMKRLVPRMEQDEEFDCMSDEELARLLKKHTGVRGRPLYTTVIGVKAIARLSKARRLGELRNLEKCSRATKRRASRILRLIEAGMIVRENGVIVFKETPTLKPVTMHKVSFLMTGRPVLKLSAPAEQTFSFPSYFRNSPLNRP